MRSLLSRQASPGTAISLVALFVALSGTAVALPGKNRVDSNDPKRGSIGTRAIANNSIRSGDIRTNNVRTSDINNDSVTGDDVDEETLEQVPSAEKANTAATAGNAGALDGVDSTGFLRAITNRVRSSFDAEDEDYGDNASLLQLNNLAGGTYSVTAKLLVDNDGGAAETVTCTLVRSTGTVVLDSSTQVLGAGGAAAHTLNYVLIGTVAMPASGTADLFLRCTQIGGDNDAEEMRIVAIKEGN